MRPYWNPIIPGFYPDPSVCRVGPDYYLANSSFEYFPAVPLWHSRDLVSWEQLGHVLTRDSQVPLVDTPPAGGIFACTIREHKGTFYLVTTNTNWFGTGAPNFLVKTTDVRGPWSEPVPIRQIGIDPSLFFDDDGRAYYTGVGFDEAGKQGIILFELDVDTGDVLSKKQVVWYGSGGRNPEGPHLYRKDGWYYLLIAEGGTEYGHMVTIARSRCIWGPYESCPANPILSHRDDAWNVFQGVGHADLIDTPGGEWFMVVHGFRPSQGQLHHMGRETMLAPVAWQDGWPVVNGGDPLEPAMAVEGYGPGEPPSVSFRDDFRGDALAPRYAHLWNPIAENYETGSGLLLHGSGCALDDDGQTTFVGFRQQQMELGVETSLTFEGNPTDEGVAGLCVFHTREHHYDLCVRREGSGLEVFLRKHVGDLCVAGRSVRFEETRHIVLRIEADCTEYQFFAGLDAEALTPLGTGRTQLLSSEVMVSANNGCLLGLFAEGHAIVRYDYLQVTESAEQRARNHGPRSEGYPA